MQPFLRTHDRFPDDPPRFCVFQRFFHMLHCQIIFIPDIEESFFRPDGNGCDGKALDHRMGIAFQDRPVHECARVSLVAVAGHILGEVIIGSCCAPLPPGREASPAPSPQSGRFHFCDHFVRRHLQGFLKRLIAAQFQVVLNILRIDLSNMTESQFLLMCVERVFLLGTNPVPLIIFIHEPRDLLIFQHTLLQNFRHIFWFYFIVDQIIRHDLHDRTIFAETVTSRCLNLRDHIGVCAVFFYFTAEGFYHVHTAVCPAPGAAADQYLFLHITQHRLPSLPE